MKIKRIIIVFLILLLISGCGKKNAPETPSESVAGTNEISEKATDADVTGSDCTSVPEEESATVEERTSAGEEKTDAASDKEETAAATTVPEAVPSEARAEKTTEAKTSSPQETSLEEKTEPPTEKASEPVSTEAKSRCTVTISCATVLDNPDKLKKNKAEFIPAGGVILSAAPVEIKDGDTVFDVIRRACAENVCGDNCVYCRNGGIQIEYTFNPGFNTYYIEGIHQLYEKDCGSMSGWMYSVNGIFPNVGAGSYTVSDGDEIVFAYTCDMGEDIGNVYIANQP